MRRVRGVAGLGRATARVLDLVGWPTLMVLVALFLVLWWNHGLTGALLFLPYVLWFVALATFVVEVWREIFKLWRVMLRGGLRGRSLSLERLSLLRPLLLRFAMFLLVLFSILLLPDLA